MRRGSALFLLVAVGWLLVAPVGAQVTPAPRDGEATAEPSEAGGGDLSLFGEEFRLVAEDMEIEIRENEVAYLDAQRDVVLEMDQFTITGVRLQYSDRTKMLIAWGDDTQRCLVVQEDAISRCDQFIYNVDTGETRFIGRPEIEFKRPEDEQANLMRADNIAIEQGKETKRTVVRLRSNAVVGSRAMLDRQLQNPHAVNPSIALGDSSSKRPKLPPVVIDDVITTAPIRITNDNVGEVSDGTERDLEKIEGKRDFQTKDAEEKKSPF